MTGTQDDMSFDSIECTYPIVELTGKENCTILNDQIDDVLYEVGTMIDKHEKLVRLVEKVKDIQVNNALETRKKNDTIDFLETLIGNHLSMSNEYIKMIWRDTNKVHSKILEKKIEVAKNEKKPKLPQTINGHSIDKVLDTVLHMQKREIDSFLNRMNEVNKKVMSYAEQSSHLNQSNEQSNQLNASNQTNTMEQKI